MESGHNWRDTGARNTELQAIKVELHVDSTKVAEAILRNPSAGRQVAEATTKYALGRKARE